VLHNTYFTRIFADCICRKFLRFEGFSDNRLTKNIVADMFFPLTFLYSDFFMKQYDNPALPAAIFSIQSGRTLSNTHNYKAAA
jgi:hypothetical protein